MKDRQVSVNDVKTGAPVIFLRGFIALIVACFALTGCALMQLHKDVQASMDSTVIVGHVYADLVVNGPLIVAACPTPEGKKIAHYTVLHDSGEYELMVGQGTYYVFAFRDNNSNLIYEAGEPAGQYGAAEPVNVPAVGVVFDIDIVIPEEGEDIEIPHGVRIAPVTPFRLHSRQAGDITDLDDERFSGEYGAKGFWEPYAFFKELGGNIYFLEEYDPEKIPVLFIHGATGTPEGWRYLVDHLDSARPEMVLLSDLCVMLKKLSSEYHIYASGNFFRSP